MQAVRAVWDTWQHGTPLAFHGEHYDLSLMVPLFDAGPIEPPPPPVHLAGEATTLSRAQRWEELPAPVSDEVLDRFAVIGTHDEIGAKLLERFGDVVTDVEFSIAVRDDTDRARLADLAARIQEHDDAAARAAIAG